MTATAAVAGVVASLALCVALTVMVASFRGGVAQWLDAVLPADLYARTAQSSGLADNAWLPQSFAAQAASTPGIARVQAGRTRALSLAPGRPTVALVTRELGNNPGETLPFIETPLPANPGETGVYVSEAMRALYAAEPGSLLTLPLERPLTVRVLGIWRDYARQFGTIAIDASVYRQWTGDDRITDLAVWLDPGADLANVQAQLRAVAPDPDMLDFARKTELRQLSLNIFDRSFAVTSYLQVVAIGIGLLGIAASLSAQIMARRKEFGLLAHLGLTRRQVMALVVGETAVWLAAGVLVGLALGAVISLILVHVVNPQSFHWTMDTVWPLGRLAALSAGVLVAGLLTASLCTRQAAGRSAVLAVKEDW
jgi:putative ABC transport system permease protein